MSRLLAIGLVLALSTASLTPVQAQDRGPTVRDRGAPAQTLSGGCPQVDVGEAVRRATAGREGRFLGATVQCTTVVIRWEDPGGRVRDIRVQGRPVR